MSPSNFLMAIKNGRFGARLLVSPPQLHHESTSFSSLFLTFYCQVNVKHSYHLLIFPVAMEVLPVQAPKVPCERILSFSKETCALRRGCIISKLLRLFHQELWRMPKAAITPA